MKIRTVRELIDCLSQFNPDAEIDVKVMWYDRNNFNVAHRNYDHVLAHRGIAVYCIAEDGVVSIENAETDDIECSGD